MNETEWQGEENDRINKYTNESNELFYKALFKQKGITKDEFLKFDLESQEYYYNEIKI